MERSPPAMAVVAALRGGLFGGELRRLPRRCRAAGRSPRDAAGGARAADPPLLARPRDRQVALSSRDRHALGTRAVRRGRQVPALPAATGRVRIPRDRPSERTSDTKRRQGHITKAGPPHARRLLVEAAHHYRRPPQPARHSPAASKAKTRASSRSPGARNGACPSAGNTSRTNAASPPGVVAIAVAREIARFLWRPPQLTNPAATTIVPGTPRGHTSTQEGPPPSRSRAHYRQSTYQ
jgi:hypothetical protein